MQRGLDPALAELLSSARAGGHIDSWSRSDRSLHVHIGCVTYNIAIDDAAAFLRGLIQASDGGSAQFAAKQ